MRNLNVDCILDLSRGDCAKARLAYSLLKNNKYDICVKCSGAQNAGGTVYYENQKFVLQLIPPSIFFNIKSIIGCNCLISPEGFLQELETLQTSFNKIDSLKHILLKDIVKIDRNAFIITKDHIAEDSKDSAIGTTKQGVGPAAKAKYGRISQQVKEIDVLKPFLTDLYEEMSVKKSNYSSNEVLAVSAQGFYLDLHEGQYPFVTSTHCTMGGILLNGIPFSSIRDSYGAIKAYSSYVGADSFQPEGQIYKDIQEKGKEFGSVTGRKRQVNFLELTELKRAVDISGVNVLVVAKMDVLKELNCWKVLEKGVIKDLETEEGFKKYIENYTGSMLEYIYSYSPETL